MQFPQPSLSNPRTRNFPQWLASPTKFCVIPVEEKQIVCCQNLLKAIPKRSTLDTWSSPAPLFCPCFLFWWARPPTTQFLKPDSQELFLTLPSRSGPASKQMSVLADSPSLYLWKLYPSVLLSFRCCRLQDYSFCFLTHLSFSNPISFPVCSPHWSQCELWEMWVCFISPFPAPTTTTSPH